MWSCRLSLEFVSAPPHAPMVGAGCIHLLDGCRTSSRCMRAALESSFRVPTLAKNYFFRPDKILAAVASSCACDEHRVCCASRRRAQRRLRAPFAWLRVAWGVRASSEFQLSCGWLGVAARVFFWGSCRSSGLVSGGIVAVCTCVLYRGSLLGVCALLVALPGWQLAPARGVAARCAGRSPFLAGPRTNLVAVFFRIVAWCAHLCCGLLVLVLPSYGWRLGSGLGGAPPRGCSWDGCL